MRVTRDEEKLGLNSSITNDIVVDGALVGRDRLLHEEGRGFRVAMTTLDGSRIGIAAQTVGIAQAAYDVARGYAQERRAFGKAIAGFEAIQHKLADMSMEIDAARLLTYRAAWLKQNDRPHTEAGAKAKLFASEGGPCAQPGESRAIPHSAWTSSSPTTSAAVDCAHGLSIGACLGPLLLRARADEASERVARSCAENGDGDRSSRPRSSSPCNGGSVLDAQRRHDGGSAQCNSCTCRKRPGPQQATAEEQHTPRTRLKRDSGQLDIPYAKCTSPSEGFKNVLRTQDRRASGRNRPHCHREGKPGEGGCAGARDEEQA
jgi:hypothetical protein